MFFNLNLPRNLDQLFGPLLEEFETGSFGSRDPRINLWESAEAYHLEAEIPGLTLEDLSITVQDDVLVLEGERRHAEPEGATSIRQERSGGTFSRRISLPRGVDAPHVNASLKDGILAVNLPKQESLKPRKIQVRLADA